MAKSHYLHAACAVAMLAAVPAWAQTDTPIANAGGNAKTPTTQKATPSDTSSAAPAPMHRSAMATHHAMDPDAQNAAVDQLNDQSYQAAQQGMAYNGTTGNGSPAASSGSKL